MSYLQRTSDDSTPFAMTYNSTQWGYTDRPDTATETWLTNYSTAGYEFTGQGYIFGFAVAVGLSIGQILVEDSAAPQYTMGNYLGYSAEGRSASDDEAIGYGNKVIQYQGDYYTGAWTDYTSDSRFNCIRME
jgi:hypothetical protein